MNKNKFITRKISFAVIMLILVSLGYLYIHKNQSLTNKSNSIVNYLKKPFITATTNTQTQIINPTVQPDPTNTTASLPAKINMQIPFTTQAPFGIWDDLHNDACEEASVISGIYYLENKLLTPDLAETDIQALVNWQIKNFGGQYDLPVDKVSQMVDKFYSRKSDIYYDGDVTIAKIKELLASNHPIIMPLAGRDLKNPFYRAPGPVYHMIVIRGYDDASKQFIVNDVGTKHGENYNYDYQKLFNAIYDMPLWQQDKTSLDANPNIIYSGRKAMLVIN